MNYKNYIPWGIYKLNRRIKNKEAVARFIAKYESSSDEEIQKAISYVRENGITNYPNTDEKKYYNLKIAVKRDDDGYPYVIHRGDKKLFFPIAFTDDMVKKSYRTLLQEQDIDNSHHYLEKDRMPDRDDVVADIGAAEGIFTLDIIDNVKKVYLFEMDENWFIPLEKTFVEYGDKVQIVKKYVSNVNDDYCVTLDKYFENKDLTFIKADIEGAEISMLEGGKAVLNDKIKKALICTYHRKEDENNVTNIMLGCGYKKNANKGFLLENMDISTGEMMDVHDLRRGVCFFYK